MRESILFVSAFLTLLGLVLLLTKPLWGVIVIFIARPFVDTTWDTQVLLELKLTEIISTLVPLIIFMRMMMDSSERRPFKDMPLKWIWIIWSVDAVFFSTNIMFQEGWLQGLQVVMRHLNGITGFYMVQAYCRSEEDFRRFAWGLVVAGIFPMAMGLYEGVTGVHWTVTLAEDNVVRNIGLYHDAITIRYFALQTLMGLLMVVSVGKKKPSVLIMTMCAGYALVAAFVVKGAYSKSGLSTLGLWLLLWPIMRKSVKGLVALGASIAVVSAYYSTELMDSAGFVFKREIGAVQGTAGVEHAFGGRWGIWTDLLSEWQALGPVAKTFGAGHLATFAHNDYIQILFHGGILGLIIYVTLLFSVGTMITRMVLQKRDVWAMAALFAFIMWMVDTMGLVPSAYSGYQWFVWGIIGYSLRHRQDEKYYRQETRRAVAPARFENLLGST